MTKHMNQQPRIAVIGDFFNDNYWIGEASRISPEAPVPVVKITKTQRFAGGGGNVRDNLLALGAEVICVEPSSSYLPTKHRLMVGDYQLARWDENDRCGEARLGSVDPKGLDAVVISDYAKGAVTDKVIDTISSWNLPTFIDSKRSPRDFDIVMNPYFFPNQKEYDAYRFDFSLQPNVILKRGPHGIEHHSFGRVIETLPAWADHVVSVTGAGDTAISAFVFASLSGRPALAWANAAAAVVVGKPWTATATVEEVEKVLGVKYGVSARA